MDPWSAVLLNEPEAAQEGDAARWITPREAMFMLDIHRQ
jgi:hypothetical protein